MSEVNQNKVVVTYRAAAEPIDHLQLEAVAGNSSLTVMSWNGTAYDGKDDIYLNVAGDKTSYRADSGVMPEIVGKINGVFQRTNYSLSETQTIAGTQFSTAAGIQQALKALEQTAFSKGTGGCQLSKGSATGADLTGRFASGLSFELFNNRCGSLEDSFTLSWSFAGTRFEINIEDHDVETLLSDLSSAAGDDSATVAVMQKFVGLAQQDLAAIP